MRPCRSQPLATSSRAASLESAARRPVRPSAAHASQRPPAAATVGLSRRLRRLPCFGALCAQARAAVLRAGRGRGARGRASWLVWLPAATES